MVSSVKQVFTMTKDGLKKKLPEVKIGNERLRSSTSNLSSDKMVVCEEHGTVPRCYIKWMGGPCAVCSVCVRTHCKITEAIVRLDWDYDNGIVNPDGTPDSGMDNPVGHSY